MTTRRSPAFNASRPMSSPGDRLQGRDERFEADCLPRRAVEVRFPSGASLSQLTSTGTQIRRLRLPGAAAQAIRWFESQAETKVARGVEKSDGRSLRERLWRLKPLCRGTELRSSCLVGQISDLPSASYPENGRADRKSAPPGSMRRGSWKVSTRHTKVRAPHGLVGLDGFR